MAAPLVAGAAALIKSLHPDWTFSQIRSQILSSVDIFDGPSWKNKTATSGRLNVARAVGGVPSPLPLRLELTSIIPKVGPLEGGVRVTLTGSDFSEQVQVLIGSRACTHVRLVSRDEINCLLPPGRQVLHNVIATNPDGRRRTLVNAFLYHPEPKIASVSPLRGPRKAGNELTVRGSQFDSGSKVKIGDQICGRAQTTSEQIKCIVPEQPIGSYPVTVENAKGQLSRENFIYLYQAQPEIQSLTPVGGPLKGGNALTVRGRDFQVGATVLIGGKPCSAVRVVNESQIRCVIPKGAQRRRVAVVVRNLNGFQSPATFYTYR